MYRIDHPRDAQALLLLLFGSGWATNHFVALIPVFRETGSYLDGSLEIAFGLYALGLVPSLLVGGYLADRFNERKLTLLGTAAVIAGNLALVLFVTPLATALARLIVGIGVGLAISSGNAWMGRISPHGGSALAGTLLSAGFAIGPFVAGFIASFSPYPLNLTLAITTTVALSALSMLVLAWGGLRSRPTRTDSAWASPSLAATRSAAPTRPAAPATPARPTDAPAGSVRRALAWAIPMALWVFSVGSLPMVVIPAQLGGAFAGSLAAGVLAFVTLGTGVTMQLIARARAFGPKAGVVGALLAALGFVTLALFGTPVTPGVAFVASVLFGVAYGLCLRAGLIDIERFAPAHRRGLAGGIFYVVAYLGFALPYALTAALPVLGPALPLFGLAAIAAGAALLRVFQIWRQPSGQ
ncbi:MAG: MFS transporter [Leucobacter sp.]